MSIEEACAAIMGEKLAAEIIADIGVPWAVFAAMVVATTDDDPDAIRAIDEYNKKNTHAVNVCPECGGSTYCGSCWECKGTGKVETEAT